MDNFDPYNVFLAIATNIPQRLKTGFVVQGHICHRAFCKINLIATLIYTIYRVLKTYIYKC